MKKVLLCFIVVSILLMPSAFSFAVDDTLKEFEGTVDRYDRGEISLAQMVVLLEHHHDEKERRMQEEDFAGWSRDELESALEEYEYPYGYLMNAHDMHIFIGTWTDDGEHYDFGYSVGARKYPESYYESEFEDDLEDLIGDLRSRHETGRPSASEIGEKIGQVFAADSELDTFQGCVDVMEDMAIMEEIDGDDLPEWFFEFHSSDSRLFSAPIHQESEGDCISSHNCGGMEHCVDMCGSDPPKLQLVAVCARDDPMKNNDLVLEHSGFKSGITYANLVEEVMRAEKYGEECEPWGYEPDLYFREKLQDSLDRGFFDWYVEEFIGDDLERHIEGGSGFERLMSFFHRTSQRVSNTLECKGTDDWPEEFEMIDIEYENGNMKFHVWEEMVPVDHKSVDMWSTLYRYNIMGDKEIMKELIMHQLSEKSSFGPSPGEVDEVKSKEEAMVLIDKLTGGFGDSLDFRLVLEDGAEEIVSRYVSINDDIIFRMGDTPKQGVDLDFTATLTLDDFYGFAKRASSIDAQAVRGPSWVDTGSRTPMMVGERLGLVFELWKSVSIDPWTTKLRLSTKFGRILKYMKEIKDPSAEEEKLAEELIGHFNAEGQDSASKPGSNKR